MSIAECVYSSGIEGEWWVLRSKSNDGEIKLFVAIASSNLIAC